MAGRLADPVPSSLILLHWFSEPVELKSVALAEPAPSTTSAKQFNGYPVSNGYSYLTRGDGKSFLTGKYTVTIAVENAAGQTFTYTGTVDIGPPQPPLPALPAASMAGAEGVIVGSTGAHPLITVQPSYAEAPCPNPILPGYVLGPEYTCGYLTVPENRSVSDGRTIRLAVATRRATAPNPKPDPIVFLTGGPGGSGLAEGPGVAQEWHPDRDVIFLDQRGALKSDPFLSCPEIDAFMASTVGLSWLASETIQQDAVTTRTCRDRLAAAGADLAAYNTTESSADLADLRIAMGIKEWNVYGVSYGTDLALQTLRDHPAGIRSVVIDAVLPPNINPIENGWRAALESSTAIYDACAAQPACHAAFPEGRAEYIQVINDLAANPRTVQVTDPKTNQEVTVVIDAYKLSYTVQFSTLIGTQKRIPLMIHDLAVGDGTEAALEVLRGVFPPDFNSYGLLWGVLCREMGGRTNPERVSAAGKRELPTFPPP